MDKLRTYAQLHLMGAHTGTAMFRAAARRHRNDPYGQALAELASDVADDRRALQSIIRGLGGTPDAAVGQGLRIGLECVGHATRTLHWWGDPSASLSEIEKLRNAVAAKAAGWQALLAAQPRESRLAGVDVEGLLERARSQEARLVKIHSAVAVEALT